MTTAYYPEMNEKPVENADIKAEFLYKSYKVECLNGLRLKENRSIKLQYVKDGGIYVYYVTPNAFDKLMNQYNISLRCLLD